MPSSLSHAMLAVAAGSAIAPRTHLRSFLVIAAVSAVTPDIDAIGRVLPLANEDVEFLGGHRGFTHSLAFAGLAGLVVAVATAVSRACDGYRVRLMVLVTVVTVAHGALDAMTSIGARTSPVQFLSPFSSRGYVFPWQPIHGPFGELFLCLLPVGAITCGIWRARRLPLPERSTERPLSIRMQRTVCIPDPTESVAIRRVIYLVLLTLLAFWGWWWEGQPAQERQDDTTQAAAQRHQ